jgi:hypothetical protein
LTRTVAQQRPVGWLTRDEGNCGSYLLGQAGRTFTPGMASNGSRRWKREPDNNIAENAIRGIALGRRNWLFAGSQSGGERAAAMYSILQTAKLNGVNPEAYLTDTLSKIAAGHPINRISELMPWSYRSPDAETAP